MLNPHCLLCLVLIGHAQSKKITVSYKLVGSVTCAMNFFLSCVFFVFPFVWVTNLGDYVEVEHLRNTQHQLHFCGRDRQRMCIFLPTLKTFLRKREYFPFSFQFSERARLLQLLDSNTHSGIPMWIGYFAQREEGQMRRLIASTIPFHLHSIVESERSSPCIDV